MIPLRHDFPAITRGDTEALAVVFKQFGAQSGKVTERDLTGAVATWRVVQAGSAPIVKTSAQGGGLTLDLPSATLSWPMAPADTKALPPGVSQYAITLTLADGSVETELAGTMTTRDNP